MPSILAGSLVALLALVSFGIGCSESPREEEGSPSVWTDPTTGVECWRTWDKHANRSWPEASSFCEDLEHGGNGDWRLPTLDEARSLVRGCPATEAGGKCALSSTSPTGIERALGCTA